MDQKHWQERMTLLAETHGVVGASLAVEHAGHVMTATTGVLNIRTGQHVTADSVFQIGSITKTWTATLLMQLVDEGLLDLDVPVITYLPDFKVADAEVSRAVTTRHLLSHTSGIDGDFFLDTGRGDDAVGLFVAAMAELPQLNPLGKLFSYCNAGFSLLGHLIATLRGQSWETVLRERLFTPLGLTYAGTFPEEALLHAPAVGHVWDGVSGTPHVTPQWTGFRSMGPSGLIHTTPSELLAFARMHCAGGVASDGTRLLSAKSTAAMKLAHVECMDRSEGTAWGLGIALDHWGEQASWGHSGQVTDQISFLQVLPEAGFAIAMCTNGGHDPSSLYEDLASEIGDALIGVHPTPALVPPARPVVLDPQRYLGTYVSASFESVISEDDAGKLQLKLNVMGALAGLVPERTMGLVGFDAAGETLLGRTEDEETWHPAVFFELDGERYFHSAGRAFRRV